MNLLVLTQKVDRRDPILGFFHLWLEEMAKRCEKLTVICLSQGEYSLPENVRVLSLGKEVQASWFTYVSRFYKYIWQERGNYEKVFVHMNPEYVVLGGLLWRMWGKKVSLWYVHKKVTWKLRFASTLSHLIFTSAKESFNLKSDKVRYVGHGVAFGNVCGRGYHSDGALTLMHIGRITTIKRCETLLQALPELKKTFSNLKVVFVGAPATDDDQLYLESLKKLVVEQDLSQQVEFVGNVSPDKLGARLCEAHATVNLAPTGGMDKVVLESWAVGVPAFFANRIFLNLSVNQLSDFYIDPFTPEVLSEKIVSYFNHGEGVRDLVEISSYVRDNFSVSSLVSRIFDNLQEQ